MHSPRETKYKMYTIYATFYIGLFTKNEFKIDFSIQNGDISFRVDQQLFFFLGKYLLNALLIHDNKIISSVKGGLYMREVEIVSPSTSTLSQGGVLAKFHDISLGHISQSADLTKTKLKNV